MKAATLLLALALILLGGSAQAAWCVVTDDVAALISETGDEVIAPGVCEDLISLGDAGFAAGIRQEDGGLRYALVDESGQWRTPAVYESLEAQPDGVRCRLEGRYGWLNPDGSVEAEAVYRQLTSDGGRLLLALETDPWDDSADMIYRLREGTASAVGIRTTLGLEDFHDGRMRYRAPDSGLYGFLDGEGGAVIAAGYRWAGAFSAGAAIVLADSGYGVIDPDGAWIVPPDWDQIARGDGFFVCVREETLEVYDPEGRQMLTTGAGERCGALGSFVWRTGDGTTELMEPDGATVWSGPSETRLSEGNPGAALIDHSLWGERGAKVVTRDGEMPGAEYHMLPLGGDWYAFAEMDFYAYSSDLLGGVRYSADYSTMRFGVRRTDGTVVIPAEWRSVRRLDGDCFLLTGAGEARLVDAHGSLLWQWSGADLETS